MKPISYHYRDPDGELLFWKVRYPLPDGGKTFGYKWRDERGRVHTTKPEVEPIRPCKRCGRLVPAPFWADAYLYRLPEVLAGVRAKRAIWWCEGEKDAETVAAQGKAATSHHGGAGKVYPAMAQWLAGARVYLAMDNDLPGYYDAWERRRVLRMVGARVVFRAPVKPYKDVTDHIEAGFKLRDLRKVTVAEVRQEAKKFNPGTAGGYAHLYGAGQ